VDVAAVAVDSWPTGPTPFSNGAADLAGRCQPQAAYESGKKGIFIRKGATVGPAWGGW
jgi:hypothetical protein